MTTAKNEFSNGFLMNFLTCYLVRGESTSGGWGTKIWWGYTVGDISRWEGMSKFSSSGGNPAISAVRENHASLNWNYTFNLAGQLGHSLG